MSFQLECESCRRRFVARCENGVEVTDLLRVPCPACLEVVLVLPADSLGQAEEIDLGL